MDGRDADPLLAYARQLENSDRALADTRARVEELRRDVAAVRARAAEIETLLTRLPEARCAREEAVAAAEEELGGRVAEAEQAQRALADVERTRPSPDELAAARRAVVRTRDAAATAEGRLGRAREAREGLEREVERARADVPEVERLARELAARIGSIPRVAAHASVQPEPGLAATLAWAARAEPALFVARSGLDSERERVVREANELGASALGEPLAATSVSLVRERLERRA